MQYPLYTWNAQLVASFDPYSAPNPCKPGEVDARQDLLVQATCRAPAASISGGGPTVGAAGSCTCVLKLALLSSGVGSIAACWCRVSSRVRPGYTVRARPKHAGEHVVRWPSPRPRTPHCWLRTPRTPRCGYCCTRRRPTRAARPLGRHVSLGHSAVVVTRTRRPPPHCLMVTAF